MDIQKLIKKYGISLYGEDKIRVSDVALLKKNGEEEIVKSKKPEIMAFLRNEEEEKRCAYEERQEKIKSIEGLEEIRNAIREQIMWREDFNRAMQSPNGCISMREKPEDNIDGLKQKYPRAAAYLAAEDESFKSNYELSSIGKKALEAIINGEDHEVVMERMNREQKEFTDRHFWD